MPSNPFGQDRRQTDHSPAATEARAMALVNPASGLANDYLNIFNELVMLVEQLPEIPEFADDILAWRPRSYEEYFRQSNLPGRQGALDAYARLERSFRDEFEAVVKDLDKVATICLISLRRLLKKGASEREALVAECERTGIAMRELLLKASNLVDHGATVARENAQRRADRLFAARQYAIKEVEDFWNKPRFVSEG
jgi:hypothetical protein